MNAPSCPISYGQFENGRQWGSKGGTTLKDLIHSVPAAHDLASAIRALNMMGVIISMINRSSPAVNNVHVPGAPDTKMPGEDNKPSYQDSNWMVENRTYSLEKLENPDNPQQYIEINTLQSVSFHNNGTDYRLNYSG